MKVNLFALSLVGTTLLVLSASKPAAAITTSLTDFSDVSAFTLNQDAAQIGNRLRLAVDSGNFSRGTAFYSTPFAIDGNTSFTTNFQFQITGGEGVNGGDGITFMIQNDSVNALGNAGDNIGYGGISNSVAVEFDTINNGGIFNDPNNNHIGLNLNGSPSSLQTAVVTPDLNDGSILNAWIDYNGSSDRLDVFLSDTTTKPGTALLTDTVDLSSTVGSQGYFGFSAATGLAHNNHDLLNLEFSSSTAAVPFEFSPGLGLVMTLGLFGSHHLWKRRTKNQTIEL